MPNYVVTTKLLETAGALGPDDVVAYLTSRGWTDVGPYGPLARLYRLQIEGHLYEAVVPTIRDVGDFEWRIIEVILLLSKIDKNNPEEICKQITKYLMRKFCEELYKSSKERMERHMKMLGGPRKERSTTLPKRDNSASNLGGEKLANKPKNGKGLVKKKRA